MKKSQFTEEQIAPILQEGALGQTTQIELCRKHCISQNTYYTWKHKYGGMETEDIRLLKDLGRENVQLKRLLAERDLEVEPPNNSFEKTGRRSR